MLNCICRFSIELVLRGFILCIIYSLQTTMACSGTTKTSKKNPKWPKMTVFFSTLQPATLWLGLNQALCRTLNSWIGEFVVSFFAVTNMLLVGSAHCLVFFKQISLESSPLDILPFNSRMINLKFGGPYNAKFSSKYQSKRSIFF